MDTKVRPKSEQTRLRILEAAAAVVGRIGYDKASVAEITREAGLSTGLFYYYFPNREDLLNQLLPSLGEEMIEFIATRVRPLAMGIEREVAGFVAYFDFLAIQPAFYRVLHEAPVYVPAAYERHFERIVNNYVLALKQQKKAGFISAPEADLLAIAYSLIGIRESLTQLFARIDPALRSRPRNFVRIYRGFLTNGIFAT